MKGPRHLSLAELGSRDQKALEALGAVPDEFVILGERVITKAAKDAFPEAPAWAVRELVKFAGGDGFYTLKTSQQAQPYSGANPWARETFNLTQQIVIGKQNPELAKELAREAAGVPQR